MPRRLSLTAVSCANNRGGLSYEMIRYAGGVIFLAATGSESQTRSVTAELAVADELDAWKANADATSPIDSVRARGSEYGERFKLMMMSTPTAPERSFVYREYDNGSKGVFHVPCPHCAEMGELDWDTYRNGSLHCAACGASISDEQRYEAIENGVWVHGDDDCETRRTFTLSRLYSHTHTMAQIAREYNPKSKRGFYQQVLGKPYAGDVIRDMEPEELAELFVEGDPEDKDVVCRTVGIDVQGNRIEWQLVDWLGDMGMRPHVRRHQIQYIAFNDRDAAWRKASADIRQYRPDMIFIDMEPVRFRTEEFVHNRFGMLLRRGRVRLCKGFAPSFDVDNYVRARAKAAVKVGVAVDALKEAAHAYLETRELTVNAHEVPDNFMDELLGEKIRMIIRGSQEVPRWEKVGDNEALDCFAYAIAARHYLGVGYKRTRFRLTNEMLSKVSI